MNNVYIYMSPASELYHHGIRGQKWGVRHGPPYPLEGGKAAKREKHYKPNKASILATYNKRHTDKVISTKDKLTTLSYNPDRTKNTDMFFAAYTTADKHQYNALFNKKIDQDLYDADGHKIGTGKYYKFRINNTVTKDIKVASEDSGADAFQELYKKDRDFANFVTDPERLEKRYTEQGRYVWKGYKEGLKALHKLQNDPDSEISQEDVQKIYRVFNYSMPSDGLGNAREAKDVSTQRAKFFKKLKENGYGAVLDVNDALYGGFKAQAPVIVFDMDSIVQESVKRVSGLDHGLSTLVYAGYKALQAIG